jgi:hypothetical protein
MCSSVDKQAKRMCDICWAFHEGYNKPVNCKGCIHRNIRKLKRKQRVALSAGKELREC